MPRSGRLAAWRAEVGNGIERMRRRIPSGRGA
jgi:hypothetical protein